MTVVTGGFGPQLLIIVPASLVVCVLTGAISILLAALHVYFRDIRYIVQAALLAWFYVTPVIYPLDAVHSLRPHLFRLDVEPEISGVTIYHCKEIIL